MTTEEQAKEIIREVLYRTVTTGNGGYASEFGPVLLGKMVQLTDYDMNDREIIKRI